MAATEELEGVHINVFSDKSHTAITEDKIGSIQMPRLEACRVPPVAHELIAADLTILAGERCVRIDRDKRGTTIRILIAGESIVARSVVAVLARQRFSRHERAG